MTEAHARRTDPWTSFAAAKGIDVSRSQAAVMFIFSSGYAWPRDGMTLEQITEAVHGMCVAPGFVQGGGFSDSLIRSAVKECVDKGLLVDTGNTAMTKHGKKARLIRPPTKETLF